MIVPHPDILAAARLLHLMTRETGAREVTMAVRCDGTVELRSECPKGFHLSTERFDLLGKDS